MTTSFNINEALLKEALALDNQVNIDSLVETALHEYIQRRSVKSGYDRQRVSVSIASYANSCSN